MKNLIINMFEKRVFKDAKPLPEFRSGDTVRVHYKIQEGADSSKFRIQTYEGIVTRFRRGTAGSSFTVRKISAGGIGVERVFPSMSPLIDKVEIIAQGLVRRSRLYAALPYIISPKFLTFVLGSDLSIAS
jgi:large subunit ribosomal protein L19